jgi:hypothetical protein
MATKRLSGHALAERCDEAVSMYRSGQSVAEITVAMECSYDTVRRYLRLRGIEVPRTRKKGRRGVTPRSSLAGLTNSNGPLPPFGERVSPPLDAELRRGVRRLIDAQVRERIAEEDELRA